MRGPGLAGMIAGFVVWSVAFVILYGVHGVGCAYGWDTVTVGPTNLQRLVQVALWLAFLPPLAGLALWLRQQRRRAAGDAARRWVALVGETTAWAGLAATLITFAPSLGTAVCT